jgi:hypothetical protein
MTTKETTTSITSFVTRTITATISNGKSTTAEDKTTTFSFITAITITGLDVSQSMKKSSSISIPGLIGGVTALLFVLISFSFYCMKRRNSNENFDSSDDEDFNFAETNI